MKDAIKRIATIIGAGKFLMILGFAAMPACNGTLFDELIAEPLTSESGSTDEDTTSPAIVSISPADSSTVPADPVTVEVEFDEAIDTTTVSLDNDGSCSGSVQLSADNFTTCIALDDDASFDEDSLTLSLASSSELDVDETYQLKVTTALTDTSGNGLESDYTSEGFTTNGLWENDDYPYRQEVSFGSDHSDLPAGYTISITMDTRVGETNVQSTTGDDVRVFWQPNGGTAVELDRIGSPWNDENTVISWQLVEAVTSGLEASGGYYYIYYGDPDASSPPEDDDAVYQAASDFDDGDSSTLGDGWSEFSTGGTNLQITGGVLELCGTDGDSPDSGAVKDIDELTDDFTVSFDWTMDPNTEGTWMMYINVGDGASMTNTDDSAGVGAGFYFGESTTFFTAPTTDYMVRYDPASGVDMMSSTTGGPWFVELKVDVSAETYDFYIDEALVYADAPFVNTGVTLDQIRIIVEQFNCIDAPTIDNFKITLDAATDPSGSLGDEESN